MGNVEKQKHSRFFYVDFCIVCIFYLRMFSNNVQISMFIKNVHVYNVVNILGLKKKCKLWIAQINMELRNLYFCAKFDADVFSENFSLVTVDS